MMGMLFIAPWHLAPPGWDAGVGLDFSSASSVIFAELPDEVAHVRQAEDRAHRKGQTQAVNVYFLIARGTIEERK